MTGERISQRTADELKDQGLEVFYSSQGFWVRIDNLDKKQKSKVLKTGWQETPIPEDAMPW